MRLLARNGPLAGGVLTLADGLTLGGPTTGRRSAGFRTSGAGGFVVEALADDAAVFVNGLPVATGAPVQIEPRDELRIGESQFVVRAEEEAPAPGSSPARSRCGCPRRRAPSFSLASTMPCSRATCRPARATAATWRRCCARPRRSARFAGSPRSTRRSPGLSWMRFRPAAWRSAGAPGGPPAVRSAWSAPGVAVERCRSMTRCSSAPRASERHWSSTIDGRQAIAAPLDGVRPCRRRHLGRGGVRHDARRGARAAAARGRRAGGGRARAVGRDRSSRDRNEQLRAEINLEHNMVGTSRPMRTLFERIARVARTDSTILLRGRERHRQGARRARGAPQQPPRRPAVHRDQLRGPHRNAPRIGVVRPREGRLHRRDRPQEGQDGARRRRHALPRRDRRAAAASCRRSCCARCRSGSSNASAARGRCAWISG